MTKTAKPIFIDIDDNLKHTRVALLVDLDEFLVDVAEIRGRWGIDPNKLLKYGSVKEVKRLVERSIWRYRFPNSDIDAVENLTEEDKIEVGKELADETKDSKRIELLFGQNKYDEALDLLAALDESNRYRSPSNDIEFTLDDLILKYGCPLAFRGLILKVISCGEVRNTDYKTVEGYIDNLMIGELQQEMIRKQKYQITLSLHPWSTQKDVINFLSKNRTRLIGEYRSEVGNEILPDKDTMTTINLTRMWYWTRKLKKMKYAQLVETTYIINGKQPSGELEIVANMPEMTTGEKSEVDVMGPENRIKQRIFTYANLLDEVGQKIRKSRGRWELSWRNMRHSE